MTLAALISESKDDREAWRYTNLIPFASLIVEKTKFVANIKLPEALTRQRLVFVDGLYRADLSQIEGLPEGFVTAFDKEVSHCALRLSGQTCLAIDPVEVLFFSTAQEEANEAEVSLSIELGENSRLTLLERHVSSGKGAHVRQVNMSIKLAAQAKLVHGKIVAENGEALHFAKTKVKVAQGAFYDHFGLIKDGKLTRCDTDITLAGTLAEARLLGLMLLQEDAHGSMVSSVRHEATAATSRQICKAVINDEAQGAFQGKIYVAQGAQKTDGYQLCRALLLSDKAEMDAKPELEIYADDVKCSHGTTIGDLDEGAHFYLCSRGIPAAEARAMLVESFTAELVDQLPEGELQTAVRNEVTAWLK